MTGHESHVNPDGTEHEPSECHLHGCTLTASMRRILDDLDAGRLVVVRQQA